MRYQFSVVNQISIPKPEVIPNPHEPSESNKSFSSIVYDNVEKWLATQYLTLNMRSNHLNLC